MTSIVAIRRVGRAVGQRTRGRTRRCNRRRGMIRFWNSKLTDAELGRWAIGLLMGMQQYNQRSF